MRDKPRSAMSCTMNRHLLHGALLFVNSVALRGHAQTPDVDATAQSALPPAASSSPGTPPSEPPVRYHLANGLEVSLQRDARRPRVAISVVYRVGSADDPEGYRGLAHLVEHMMFEGSSSRVGSDYFEHIEGAGTTGVQGTTGRDQTQYTSELPRVHLRLGLWHEASRMAYLLKWIDAQDLSRARAAVLNEADLRQGKRSRFSEIISEKLYPSGHPYHVAEENLDDIEAISLNDVRWFFQRWYGPANASLAVVGDFDVQAARDAIDAMFAPIVQRGPSAQPIRPAQSRLNAKYELDIVWRSKENACSLVWLVPTDADQHDRALDVLARHLNFELERLVTRHQGLSGGHAVYEESERAGELKVDWYTSEESDGEQEARAMEALLDSVRSSPLTEAQLVRARDSIRISELFARESFARRSLKLASVQDRASSWDYDVMASQTAQVTSAQVLAAARYAMAPERSLTACASYGNTTSSIRLRGTRITPLKDTKP